MVRARHRVLPVADLPVGTHKVVQIGKRELGIFNVNGAYHALPNLCPHQIGPLCEGKVSGTTNASLETGWQVEWINDGEIITCPWHGIEYHIPTGQCIPFPEISIRSYQVVEEEGWLIVEL